MTAAKQEQQRLLTASEQLDLIDDISLKLEQVRGILGLFLVGDFADETIDPKVMSSIFTIEDFISEVAEDFFTLSGDILRKRQKV